MSRTTPDHETTGWPPGVPYIIGNEGCERFSFYGMKAILLVHMLSLYVIARESIATMNEACANVGTSAGRAVADKMHELGQTFVDLVQQVQPAVSKVEACTTAVAGRSQELCQGIVSCVDKGLADPVVCEAAATYSMCVAKEGGLLARHDYHLFVAGVYAFPMIGALVADRLLGKYQTIIWLSLVYCAGHAVLSVGEDSLMGMKLGLLLIAVGSGGIKPCVSAHVGDQFGKKNWFRIQTVFQMFYFIINFGSFFSTLMIPWVRDRFSTSVAFAIPGILMFVATVVFWMGRNKFVHIPARPGGKLGLLDALSSVLLFLSVGHLFATTEFHLAWYVLVGISVGFLAAGLGVFALRQSIEQDDSFLPVLFHLIIPSSKPKTGAVGAGESAAVPGVGEKATEDDPDVAWLRKSSFFGGAVEHFGLPAVEGTVAVLKIISIFVFVSVFWALFDQHGSSWVEQATQMNLRVNLPIFGEMTLLASQISALNPIMVMILIPITAFAYKMIEKKVPFGPLRRMTVGMFVTAVSFVIAALVQAKIASAGLGQVSVLWQVLQYFVVTLAEVMVSITGLEFAYTQAPKRMKSTIMGFWLLTVALGNVLVAVMSTVDIESKLKSLAGDAEGAAAAAESSAAQGLIFFFAFFAAAMAVAALLFAIRAKFYKPKSYPQE